MRIRQAIHLKLWCNINIVGYIYMEILKCLPSLGLLLRPKRNLQRQKEQGKTGNVWSFISRQRRGIIQYIRCIIWHIGIFYEHYAVCQIAKFSICRMPRSKKPRRPYANMPVPGPKSDAQVFSSTSRNCSQQLSPLSNSQRICRLYKSQRARRV
jgi:hypothetical protein